MEYLSIEEMNNISYKINNQEGRKYPCSNQIVTCGFFSTKERWDEFLEANKNKIKWRAVDMAEFDNGEKWRYFNFTQFSYRGFRFYKIKIDCCVNREVFLQCIYPCCLLYCKEIEWL